MELDDIEHDEYLRGSALSAFILWMYSGARFKLYGSK